MSLETAAAQAERMLAAPRKVFWVAFILSFLIFAGWAVASPHMGSPDEPAHAAKAAATVRGQLFADESNHNPGRGNFRVPVLFEQAWAQPCYAFQPDTPANCSPPISGDLDSVVDVTSHVARYNPIYYAIIGLPTLLPLTEHTFTLMRLMSALINALLVGATFRVLAQHRHPALPTLGVFAAFTPMTFYIGGSMTPQGPEIFAAILLSVCLLSLVFDPRRELLTSRAWCLVIATGALVLTRGLSAFYLVLIVLLIALVVPRFSAIRELITDRRFWFPLAACVGLSLTGVAYTLLSGSLALGIVYPDPSLTAGRVVSQMVANTDYYLEQVLGTFGWGDVHLPVWVLIGIAGAALMIGAVGFAGASWRGRLGLVLVVALSLGVPILLQLQSYPESGLVWQGKYILPLAILAPVMAGFLASLDDRVTMLGPTLLRTIVALIALMQVVAIVVNLHRYINGANGPWLALIADPWMPAIPLWVLIPAYAATWTVAVILLSLISHRPLRHDAEQPDSRAHTASNSDD